MRRACRRRTRRSTCRGWSPASMPVGRDVGHAFLAVQQRVAPLPQLFLVAVGNAEQLRDHVHREQRGVVGDEIGVATRSASASRYCRRERADRRFEIGDAPRRERPAHEPAQRGVVGRVGGEHHRQRVALFERDAVARAVRVGIVQRGRARRRSAKAPRSPGRRCGSRARRRAARGTRGTGRRGTRTRTG